ncbi:hypothetical protein NLJ89_g2156 [Agrocybe chaxingu]|uniref:N-acetyl-D-glucosamine kinase n=1 Tax=Agrocybe chaxingu TaxID=84603 RepID=A0A9W8K6E5_9AGAR|nr:hypothetical protein NLJ89_g2156 [Agrocybe chaxingu]
MSLYLSVDCGGTKTSAVVCDASGTVVGRGSGGPSNITYLTPDSFIASVKVAIISALRAALPSADTTLIQLPPADKSPFEAAWFGVSGADSPIAIEKVALPLSKLLGLPNGPRLSVTHDSHLLAAPVRMHSDVTHAIVVIAGTGSVSVSFKEVEGGVEELGRVGGWGWLLGDEGSGFEVGRETLRHILTEFDKASVTASTVPKSSLINAIFEKFEIANIMEIFTKIYFQDPDPAPKVVPGEEKALRNLAREKRISSLPRLVFKAAFEDGDLLALKILKTTAGNLASQIAILLGDGSGPSPRIFKATDTVISFGGSLVGVDAYRDLILDDLAQRGHVFRRVVFIDDAAAVGGAALAAAFGAKST